MRVVIEEGYVKEDGEVVWDTVFSPFEALSTLKTAVPYGSRRWVPERKVWFVSPAYREALSDAMQEAGFRVAFRPPGGASPWTPPPRSGTWADSMYSALGMELGERAYRALVPILHPDKGGSLPRMQELNAARDKAKAVAR